MRLVASVDPHVLQRVTASKLPMERPMSKAAGRASPAWKRGIAKRPSRLLVVQSMLLDIAGNAL